MPPKSSGINIDITVKQLITGVVSIATTVIGLLYLVMTTYVSENDHTLWENKITKVEAYKEKNTLETKDTALLLSKLQESQNTNYSKLQNAIDKSQEDQLTLRRNVLKSVKVSKLTAREKIELRQIEEFMVRKGYLNPELITHLD